MSKNSISVAFICEEENIKPLSVAIASMLENATDSTKYDITILSKAKYSKSKTKLLSSFKDKYDCEITLTKTDNVPKNDIKSISKLVTNALTDSDNCIYLDYNVVVQRDLTELYNFDLGNQAIGGVMDVEINEFSPSVLLIDCAKIRENENMDIGNIDLKFNLRAGYFQGEKSFNFSPKVTVGKEVIDGFEKKQLREAFKENVIFSYTDEVNPFVTHDSSFVDEWYKYFCLSPLTTQEDIKTPLISVIVPVYNVEKYLELCVDSITNQSYKNLEIILVDDGSTDSSGQMCDELASNDTRINVIHKENGGLSSARNSGMDLANGEYISFVDSDDFIHPKTYSLAMNCFSETPDLDLVEWEFKNAPENDTKYYINNFEKIISTQYDVSDNKEYIKANIDYKKHYHLAWNKLFKSKLIKDTRFEVGKYHEDVFFTNEYMLGVKKAGYISNKLYYYVQRKGSIVNQEITMKNVDGVEGLYQRHILIKEHYPELIEADLQYALAYGYRRINAIEKQDNDTDKSMRIATMEILLKYYDYVMEYDSIPQNIKDDFILAKEDLIGFIEEHENNIDKPKLILLDTPVHGNIGDQAITLAEKQFLENNFKGYTVLEIPQFRYLQNESEVNSKITTKDVVLIPGGGFIGTLWMNEQQVLLKILSNFSKNKVVIFPQTTFFSDDDFGNNQFDIFKDIVSKCNNITLFTRDRNSYDLMINERVFTKDNCFLVPDIVTYLKPKLETKIRKSVAFCLRTDKEKVENVNIKSLTKYFQKLNIDIVNIDTIVDETVSPITREKFVNEKLEEFSKYQLVITDRLHGMIFSAITNTPCIAFDNISKKVSGVYDEWLSNLDYIKCIPSNKKLSNTNITELVGIMDNDYVYDNSYLNEYYDLLSSKLLPSPDDNKIKLNSIIVDKNKVTYDYTATGEIANAINKDSSFFLEYNFDLANCPESILVIPFLGNILPVVWITDATLEIEEIDEHFLHCIDEVKRGYQQMLSQLEFKGSIKINKVVKNQVKSEYNKSLCFFSGGVDATYTLINTKDKNLTLFTIWGADVFFQDVEGWEKVHTQNTKVAEQFGLPIEFVKSSFRYILNMNYLNSLITHKINDEWWHGIQHSLGVIVHSAPLCFVKNIPNIYFGASYCNKNPKLNEISCASLPSIDNYVKFANCTTFHEGFEATRLDKVRNICNFSKTNNIPINLRVCWETRTGINCCKCRKCAFTILLILAHGLNPNEFGFNVTTEDYNIIESKIKSNKISLNTANSILYIDVLNSLYMNKNLQKENIVVKSLLDKYKHLVEDTSEFIPTNIILNSYDNTKQI